ncbi:hypothetical protein DFQ29_009377 [Apophysomyces sp. BC1021]|nr:hypothetical protein DFQ29_009377 [Apophysomyces sp. BC1021]
MLQDISELDFDSYLNVTSANMQNEQQQQQQQQQSQHDILCHGHLSPQQQQQRSHPTSPLPSFEINAPEAPRMRYPPSMSDCLLSGTTDFGLLDWDLNASPNNSPHTVATDYTSSSHSPASVMLSPPYSSSHFSGQSMAFPLASPFNPPQHIRDEARKALAGYQYEQPSRTQNMSFSDFHAFNGNMPGIAIPATPIHESPPSHPSLSPSGSTSSSSLTSPLMPDQPLTAAFATIDQWQPDIKEPDQDCSVPDDHETRHWRKSKRTSYDGSPGRHAEPGLQLKKVAHNAIERRYRNNINDRIRDLKNVVPALYKARIREKGQHDDDDDDSSSDCDEIVDGVEVAKKLNKATILRKATEYITFLKHSNELADRENQILQQILAQMPGGLKVLGRFQVQKRDFEKAEQERLAHERKESVERERAERQRVLRERAAQRAALAQLIPKPERRPYRRRAKKQTTAKKTDDENGNQMFMAMFMCLVFFAAPATVSSSSSDRPSHPHHHPARAFAYGNESIVNSHSSFFNYSSSSSSLWTFALYSLYAFGIVYVCLLPLIISWLRPKRVAKPKKCLGHHHYAPEVAQAWRQLYNSLTDLVPMDPVAHSFRLAYSIVNDLMVICLPRFISGRKVVSQDDLSHAGAWVRMCELECLGGNPDESRLRMLRSCVGMFAQIKQLENDERHPTFFRPRTIARIFCTAAIQLELALPSVIAGPLVRFCWRRAVAAVEQYKALAEHEEAPDHWLIQTKDMNNAWLESESHRQIITMVATRNNFIAPTPLNCSNTFYSFALPYLTSPLDWVLYWQTLNQLQQSWLNLLDGAALKSSDDVYFSSSQLPPAMVTPVDQMVSWWVHLGLALQKQADAGDDECDDAEQQQHLLYLATDQKFTQRQHSPSSGLLQRHRAVIYNVLKATMEFQKKSGDPAYYLELAIQDRRSSIECVRQIASLPTTNLEASVLVLSSLAVNLRAFVTIAEHQFSRSVLAPQAAARYLAELRDQLAHDLALPLTRSLSPRCRKHIQSYISQADDALSM